MRLDAPIGKPPILRNVPIFLGLPSLRRRVQRRNMPALYGAHVNGAKTKVFTTNVSKFDPLRINHLPQ